MTDWNNHEYEPSSWEWVATQVEEYERTGGMAANTLQDTELAVIVMWTIGHKSGHLRKVPLMRVEHGGQYALVASKGGMPTHPSWYHNLVADDRVRIQDGPELNEYRVDETRGVQRSVWWRRAVDTYPPYQDYQANTDRQIPLFVATPIART